MAYILYGKESKPPVPKKKLLKSKWKLAFYISLGLNILLILVILLKI